MPTQPGASSIVQTTAGAVGGGTERICVFAPVPLNADSTPRQYGSAAAIYAVHGYSEGVEYAAFHFQDTRKAVLFCGIPIATAGAISRENTGGNTGTSVSTVSAGIYGVLTEHEGRLRVKTGGTIGTDQIVLEFSADGGTSWKVVRLGTASSYTFEHIGVSVSFAAGTLVADDVIHTWEGSGPRGDSAGWIAARTALAAQSKLCRTVVLCGDVQDSTEAAAFRDQMDALETSALRYTMGRVGVPDRLPLAALSVTSVAMTGAPSITFAEVGATGDTITRSAGSFISDGFVPGMIITIAGSTSNNMTTAAAIVSVTATVITLDTDDLVDEGPVLGVTITGTPSLTFSDAADTIVRSSGSWLTDGLRVGDSITLTGTASNNVTTTVTGVTALTLSVTAAALADEVIGASAVTLTGGETKAQWMARIDAAFATISSAPRIDLSAGRARRLSPFSAWNFRRPAWWAISLRENQHDLHIPPWRKKDGTIPWSLWDADGVLVEYDDWVDGAAGTAARFSTLRSYSNGPEGAFITLSLTRENETIVTSRSHNAQVVNLAQTVVMASTEDAAVGESLILGSDGKTATSDSLAGIESQVNKALDAALGSNLQGEGRRASKAVWTAATDDDLSVAEPTLNGVLELTLRGTVHRVNTVIKVNAA